MPAGPAPGGQERFEKDESSSGAHHAFPLRIRLTGAVVLGLISTMHGAVCRTTRARYG